MKKTGYVILSAVLSLVIHGIVLLVADRITLDKMSSSAAQDDRRVRVTVTDIRDLKANRPDPRDALRREAEKQLADAEKAAPQVEKVFADAELTAPPPKARLRLKGLGADILAPRLPEPEAPRPATAPLPKILEIEASDVPRDRLAYERPFTKKLDRELIADKLVPSLLSPGSGNGPVPPTLDVGMRLGDLPGARDLRLGSLPSDGEGGGAGSEGPLAPLTGGPGLNIGPDGPDGRAGLNGEQVEPLDRFVTVVVTVYRERSGGYFRADISPNPRSDALRDVPKDLFFIIDHSTSISNEKLEQFKAAVGEALEYLNPADRFNVVAFTDKPQALFPTFMPYTPETRDAGRKHVAGLMRGGMTDVFGGLAPFVAGGNAVDTGGRPLNVFLMTDGNSTVNIYEDDRFVREIVRMNPGNVSIYSFSAGPKANRNLLEFLGYHNRGFSLHVDKLRDFKDGLVDYISTHSSLIVADLDYHAAYGLGEEIFPKRLPHLYRGETLSIYGRFPEETDEIILSLTGRDGSGVLRELVFRRPVDECIRGTDDLRQSWGAQKIFHLLGLKTLAETEEDKAKFEARINEMARSYSLYVPY